MVYLPVDTDVEVFIHRDLDLDLLCEASKSLETAYPIHVCALSTDKDDIE